MAAPKSAVAATISVPGEATRRASRAAVSVTNGVVLALRTRMRMRLSLGAPASAAFLVRSEHGSEIETLAGRCRVLEAQPAFHMQEMFPRYGDRPRHIACAQRLDDRAVLVHRTDRSGRGLIDRDHDGGAAQQVAQEARQLWVGERIDQMDVERAGEPHRGGAIV